MWVGALMWASSERYRGVGLWKALKVWSKNQCGIWPGASKAVKERSDVFYGVGVGVGFWWWCEQQSSALKIMDGD